MPEESAVARPAGYAALVDRYGLEENQGRLSARKRSNHFDFLSDDEIARMEAAVQSAYGQSM